MKISILMLIFLGFGLGKECRRSGTQVFCIGRYDGEGDVDILIREWDREWCGFVGKTRIYSKGADCEAVARICDKVPFKVNGVECDQKEHASSPGEEPAEDTTTVWVWTTTDYKGEITTLAGLFLVFGALIVLCNGENIHQAPLPAVHPPNGGAIQAPFPQPGLVAAAALRRGTRARRPPRRYGFED